MNVELTTKKTSLGSQFDDLKKQIFPKMFGEESSQGALSKKYVFGGKKYVFSRQGQNYSISGLPEDCIRNLDSSIKTLSDINQQVDQKKLGLSNEAKSKLSKVCESCFGDIRDAQESVEIQNSKFFIQRSEGSNLCTFGDEAKISSASIKELTDLNDKLGLVEAAIEKQKKSESADIIQKFDQILNGENQKTFHQLSVSKDQLGSYNFDFSDAQKYHRLS